MIFSLPVGATSVLLEEPEHLVGQVQDVIVRSRLQGNLIVIIKLSRDLKLCRIFGLST